ncbi:MAG: chaperone NapD [bacterium]|nr:chaperone NapD [bacterium]
MLISALYLLFDPKFDAPLHRELSAQPGLDLQTEEPGRMILTLEAQDEESSARRLRELIGLPGVLDVQVTGFYSEPS